MNHGKKLQSPWRWREIKQRKTGRAYTFPVCDSASQSARPGTYGKPEQQARRKNWLQTTPPRKNPFSERVNEADSKRKQGWQFGDNGTVKEWRIERLARSVRTDLGSDLLHVFQTNRLHWESGIWTDWQMPDLLDLSAKALAPVSEGAQRLLSSGLKNLAQHKHWQLHWTQWIINSNEHSNILAN